MTLAFYIRYATRSLLREGQRTLLALLCIAFGVMSLVGMQLLASMVYNVMIGDPRATIGGDADLAHTSYNPFTPEDTAALDKMRADGTISAYSLGAYGDGKFIKPQNTGRIYALVSRPMGVDPATFPLAGTLHISAPQGAHLSDLLKQPMDAVLTSDVAGKLGLKVGDSFTLIGDPARPAATLRVAGVADQVPDGRGDRVIYSLQTAAALEGRPNLANFAMLVWGKEAQGKESAVISQLSSSGWHVETASSSYRLNKDAVDLFSFMLKGAGILGLFVGGIGVANTLQVLLARRLLEIATLKTVGYKRRDLLVLFGTETALLGLVGGVLGAIAALALSYLLMSLLGNVGAFLLVWSVDPWTILAGVLLGVLTSVIFGLYTIVMVSSVRPAVVLRNLPARRGLGTWLAGIALLLLLLAVATAISISVMGSAINGLGVIGGALAGLIVLAIVFGAVLFVGMSLPTPGLPLVTMARRNLKSQPVRSIFAMIALFMGVFAIGFAGSVLLDASDRLAARFSPATGYNLTIHGKQADATAIQSQLTAQGVQTVHGSIRVPVQVSIPGGKPVPQIQYLDGRDPADASWDFASATGQLGGEPDGALVPVELGSAPWSLHAGDTLQVLTEDGHGTTLQVRGFYSAQGKQSAEGPSSAVIVTAATAATLGGASAPAVYVGHLPLERLDSGAAALGVALPGAIVFNQNDVNDARNRTFQGLFAFAAGLASLALVAGKVLIANAVGLAMVERRREMGILKAVGFTGRRVLGSLLVENALLGLVSGVLGMAAVGLAIVQLNNMQPQAQLSLNPALAVAMIGLSVLLALLSASVVAWRPTHIRPLAVLREE